MDKADQLVTYYGFAHTTKKWWKRRVFFDLLDTCNVNAYILYREGGTYNNLSHINFRLEVARSLINIDEECRIRLSASVPDAFRLSGRHFPEKGNGMKECKVCSNRNAGKRKRTSLVFDTCNVPLCDHPCFKRYHTVLKYKY